MNQDKIRAKIMLSKMDSAVGVFEWNQDADELYKKGFVAGHTSRDAEVERLKTIIGDEVKRRKSIASDNEKLSSLLDEAVEVIELMRRYPEQIHVDAETLLQKIKESRG